MRILRRRSGFPPRTVTLAEPEAPNVDKFHLLSFLPFAFRLLPPSPVELTVVDPKITAPTRVASPLLTHSSTTFGDGERRWKGSGGDFRRFVG